MNFIKNFKSIYRSAIDVDPKLLIKSLLYPILLFLLLIVTIILLDINLIYITLAFALSIILWIILFNKRLLRAIYYKMDNQQNASVLTILNQNVRRSIYPVLLIPYIIISRVYVIHCLIGKFGIILFVEGGYIQRDKINSIKSNINRIVSKKSPIYVIKVGNKKNEYPISKINPWIKKLSKKLKRDELIEVINRMKRSYTDQTKNNTTMLDKGKALKYSRR